MIWNVIVRALAICLLLVYLVIAAGCHCFDLNNFNFNGKNYLQVKGCMTGTISAPPFSNIFMGKFEDTHIYSHIQQFCKLYLRYTDDLFFI